MRTLTPRDTRRVRPKPLPQQLGAEFSVADARRAGATRNRVDASDLTVPFHGARVRSHDPFVGDRYEVAQQELLERCRAFVAIAPRRYAFSHVTAARIYGIPLPERLERDSVVHVAVPNGKPPPSGRGVRGHRVHEPRRQQVAGVYVLPIEQVWLQLASVLTVDELVVAGDYLVRRKNPRSTIERMRAAVAQASGARGARTARAALADVRPLTDSPQESRMRLIIVRAGLPEPCIRFTVFNADGSWCGTPDLAYVNERIAIEYEGDDHRSDPKIFADDIDRRERFERAGWRVLRVTSRHLRTPELLVRRVRELLAARAAHS